VRSIAVVGWPDDLVQASVDYVTDRLIDASNREIAFESLRRDASIPPQLDISGVSRTRLMRVGFGRKACPAGQLRLGAQTRKRRILRSRKICGTVGNAR
jgi:hypothetical protein